MKSYLSIKILPKNDAKNGLSILNAIFNLRSNLHEIIKQNFINNGFQ